MSLSLIEQSLHIQNRNSLSMQAWREDEERRARKVARFRRYADGDHDNRMTLEQKRLLNIHSGDEDSTEFNDNLCSIILDTPLDRIQLLGVNANAPKARQDSTAVAPAPQPQPVPPAAQGQLPAPMTSPPAASKAKPIDPAQEWATDLLERNRLDALQVDVHEATLRDGNTFLMVYPDENTRLPCFSHEPAYDGSYGMVVIYETTTSETPLLAIKVWRITSTLIADTVRVNVYYEDRIERYIGLTASGLHSYTEDGDGAVIGWVTPQGVRLDYPVIPWLMPDRTPIGVPIFHFRNRGTSADNFGLSELENVLPLQDAANVVLTSLVATALLSGFPIRAAVGFQAPAAVVPGLVLSINSKDASGKIIMDKAVGDYLASVRLDQYPAADLAPLISVAQYLKEEMFAVTNTPTDDKASRQASGEARKQAEIKLLGKVKRFEVRNGNAWENAVRMAARVEAAFTADPPPITEDTTLTAQWDDADIRNDSQFVTDMLAQYEKGVIDQRTYLEAVQDVYDWDADKIDEIIQRTEAARNAAPPNVINGQDANAVQDALSKIGLPGANGTVNGNEATANVGANA